MAKPAALRTSLIWHDEVMGDVVSERPRAITIGPFDGATFITPELGLPHGFAIVRPGSRGHVLTLGGAMRGTICVGGVEHDVAELVRTSETPGFHATAISGLDWGVIELDATARYKLFFQFVPLDDVPVRPIFEADLEQRASLAFSTLLHGALIFATYQLYVRHDPPIDPTRELTARYVAARLEPMQPAAAMPAVQSPIAATVKPVKPMLVVKWHEPDVRPTKRIATLAIGHDETKQPGPPGPKSPFDAATNRAFDAVGTHDPQGRQGVEALAHAGEDGGAPNGTQGGGPPGGGPTTHGGDPNGRGVRGEYRPGTPGGLDTGPLRSGTMCTGTGCGNAPVEITTLSPTGPTDPTDTLTEKDISDVIHAAAKRLTQCYQREVNRDPSLAGTVQVRFEINADGRVATARVTASSVRSEAVSECLTRAIGFLHFPAKGRAVVNYPFVFAAH